MEAGALTELTCTVKDIDLKNFKYYWSDSVSKIITIHNNHLSLSVISELH